MNSLHLVVLDPNLCWDALALDVPGVFVFRCMDRRALETLVLGERVIAAPRHVDDGSQVPFFLPEVHLKAALVHESDIRAAQEMIHFLLALKPEMQVIPLKERRFRVARR